MQAMARVITKAAVILPFEEALLRAHGIDATFVGPSAARSCVGDARPRRGAAATRHSRRTRRCSRSFPGAAPGRSRGCSTTSSPSRASCERRRPGLHVVVSVAPSVQLDPARVPYQLVRSASLDVLRAADVALCKSGTTTLEAAVAGCPCAIVYRTERAGLRHRAAHRDDPATSVCSTSWPAAKWRRSSCRRRSSRCASPTRSRRCFDPRSPERAAHARRARRGARAASARRARPRAWPRWRRSWRGERAARDGDVPPSARLARARRCCRSASCSSGCSRATWRIRVRNAEGWRRLRAERSRGSFALWHATLLPRRCGSTATRESRCWSASTATAS